MKFTARFLIVIESSELHHASHTTHSGSHAGSRSCIIFFLVGNDAFGREEHTGNGSRIFESCKLLSKLYL